MARRAPKTPLHGTPRNSRGHFASHRENGAKEYLGVFKFARSPTESQGRKGLKAGCIAGQIPRHARTVSVAWQSPASGRLICGLKMHVMPKRLRLRAGCKSQRRRRMKEPFTHGQVMRRIAALKRVLRARSSQHQALTASAPQPAPVMQQAWPSASSANRPRQTWWPWPS